MFRAAVVALSKAELLLPWQADQRVDEPRFSSQSRHSLACRFSHSVPVLIMQTQPSFIQILTSRYFQTI